MKVKLTSFAYRGGEGHAPADATLTIDCRDLRNPYRIAALRSLSGLDAPVQEYVRCDPSHKVFIDRVLREAAYGGHIAFGCMGGRHRSVAMAEMLARELRKLGYDVEIRHRALVQAA